MVVLNTEQLSFLVSSFSESGLRAQFDAGNIPQEHWDQLQTFELASEPTPFETAPALLIDITDSVEERIVSGIGDVVGKGLDVLGGVDDKIKGWISDALSPILDLLRRIPQTVTDALGVAKDRVVGDVISLSQAVVKRIGDLAGDITEVANSLEEKILDPIVAALGEAQELIGTIDDKVKDVVNLAIAPISAITGSILDQVEGFATALRDTIPGLADKLVGAFDVVGDTIGEAVTNAFNSFIESTGLGGIKAVMDAVGRIPELVDPQGAFSPSLEEKMPAGTLAEFRENVPAMITLVIPFLSTLSQIIFSGQIERVQQASRGDHNSGLLGVSDMTALAQRGLATRAEVDDVGFRSGFNHQQIEQVFELTRQRPGTMDIIDYWRREIIDDGAATARLRDLGWLPTEIELIKKAAFPPPGVQDLIRMAVREVFSPEIARSFGQFEEIPPLFLEWSKKIGLSEEWATNYWAAHWVLPSVQQGFEMLHRGVINDVEIERLFVALDVMPFWREPIKAISFRPYTRVDVRRMYAFGVLDEAGVNRAYQDIGFDPDKAAKMTDFTIRWVDSTRKVEKQKERDLTKGDIIGLLNDGLLEPPQAISHLQTMGYDFNESSLLVQREIVQEMRQDRKADIKLIVDQAKIKVLTFQEAQDKLDGLDLTRKEMERALIEVTRATTERIRLPSKSDLDSWKELELISLDQYQTELDNLGFPAKYVALYVEAIQLEEADDILAAEERAARAAEPRSVSKGQLDSLLRTEIIDVTGYTSGLETLEFSSNAVDQFVAQITIEIEERRLADIERLERGELAAEREKLLGRVLLGKLLIKEIIDFDAYEIGLQKLGFSIESVELLLRLMRQKLISAAEEEEE